MIKTTSNPILPGKLQYILMALIVFICCFLLFSLDKDVKKFSDLFVPGIFVVLSLYFIPTFAVCYFLFRSLMKTHDKPLSLFISLIVGMPLGFGLVIAFLKIIR